MDGSHWSSRFAEFGEGVFTGLVEDVEVVVEVVALDGFATGITKVHRRVPLLLQIVRQRDGARALRWCWRLRRRDGLAKFAHDPWLTTDHENVPTWNQSLTAIFEGASVEDKASARIERKPTFQPASTVSEGFVLLESAIPAARCVLTESTFQ